MGVLRLLLVIGAGLGEYFLPPSTSTSTSQDPGPSSFSPHSEQPEVGATQGESPWMAVFLQRAEEDKEKSLKQQEEVKRTLRQHG
jgi:hypothetical protein